MSGQNHAARWAPNEKPLPPANESSLGPPKKKATFQVGPPKKWEPLRKRTADPTNHTCFRINSRTSCGRFCSTLPILLGSAGSSFIKMLKQAESRRSCKLQRGLAVKVRKEVSRKPRRLQSSRISMEWVKSFIDIKRRI